MRLNIVNVSTELSDQDVAVAVSAIDKQIKRDVAPEWGIDVDLWVTGLALNGTPAPIDNASDATVYIGDRIDDPDRGAAMVFGYHDNNYNHIPYSFVYLDICAQSNEFWSVTLSHEILEISLDPTCVFNIDGPDPRPRATGSVRYSLEICDPVKGDSYQIDTISVCNFVTRKYYGLSGKSTYTNYLNLALPPFTARPRGYVQFDDGKTRQINGSLVDAAQIEARQRMGNYRRNAKRAARRAVRSPRPRKSRAAKPLESA